MFTMYDLDMNKIEYPEGFIPLDIYISSIEKERSSSKIEGSNATIENGTHLSSRDISIKGLLKSQDTISYRLLRDEVYELFSRFDSFYIVEDYQKGKRYEVSVDSLYIPERLPTNQRYAQVEVVMYKVGLPFAESIGTSMDIHNNGINSEDGLWGFGMGLRSENDTHIYKHQAVSGTAFRVFNPGKHIHPFEQDIIVKFTNVVNSANMFQITNLTNGSRTRVRSQVKPEDIIMYDGPNVTKNDLNIFRDTSKLFVELSPGWNRFMIYYCDSADIEFDFRFYY